MAANRMEHAVLNVGLAADCLEGVPPAMVRRDAFILEDLASELSQAFFVARQTPRMSSPDAELRNR